MTEDLFRVEVVRADGRMLGMRMFATEAEAIAHADAMMGETCPLLWMDDREITVRVMGMHRGTWVDLSVDTVLRGDDE